MLFVPLAAPGAVEPLHVHDGVGVRAASDKQQLRHDHAQPTAAGASSARGGRCRTPGLRRAQIEGRSRSVRGIIWGCGLVRAGHVAVSYRHPKVGVMPDCRASTAAASSRAVWAARRAASKPPRRLPAAAWALRVGRPAADRHISRMAPSHGELLDDLALPRQCSRLR
jgi:hypothetical protein